MDSRLPARPNLEYYQKRAKKLLRSASVPASTLARAQHLVAQETGFTSWSELARAVLGASLDETTADTNVDSQTTGSVPDEAREPEIKQRYEGERTVQRWLSRGDTRLSKSGIDPRQGLPSKFLARSPDRAWVAGALGGFYDRGLISDVVAEIKSGKEATVYRCTTRSGEHLAAKVYRPRVLRQLKNDARYRSNRARGRDRRLGRAIDRMSDRGRLAQMEAWVRFEYDTICRVHEAGADVPEPVAHDGNAILMAFIGDESGAAKPLVHFDLSPHDAHEIFRQLLRNIELMLGVGRVHADLSAYNVLVDSGGSPVIIDFAQAVDAAAGDDARLLLERDLATLTRFFGRFGVETDPAATAAELWGANG